MMDQLQQFGGPVGIGVAILVVVLVLTAIRKLVTLVFVLLAIGFGGWAAAKQMGWAIPFVLPGAITEADRSELEAADLVASSNDPDLRVQPESFNEARSASPARDRRLAVLARVIASARCVSTCESRSDSCLPAFSR